MNASEDYYVTNNIIFGKETEMDYVLRNRVRRRFTQIQLDSESVNQITV